MNEIYAFFPEKFNITFGRLTFDPNLFNSKAGITQDLFLIIFLWYKSNYVNENINMKAISYIFKVPVVFLVQFAA